MILETEGPAEPLAYRGPDILVFLGAAEESGVQATYALPLPIGEYLEGDRVFWKPEKDLGCKTIRAFPSEGAKIFIGSSGGVMELMNDDDLFLEASVWTKHGR